MQKTTKRKYNSTRRHAHARKTKMDIMIAARDLFMKNGYVATTIQAIALQAGVAQETIYAVFNNKRNILAFLLDVSVNGDDKAIPLMERPGPQSVMQASDQRNQIDMFSKDISGILSRVTPIYEIAREAAKSEPEIAEMLTKMLNERLKNMIRFSNSLSSQAVLRNGMTNEEAGEILWTITSPEIFHLLIVDRKWTQEHYIIWLKDTLLRLLLP